MTSRALALLVACLASACGGSEPASAPAGPARRVILISCDTLRADRLGLYGYGRPTSPALDAFAREAVVFAEAYSTAPMTGPAMSSVLTGRYPLEIGTTFDNHLLMPPEVRTLPEVLAEHGIASAAVVSNFVLRKPTASGVEAGTAQGFLHYDDTLASTEANRLQFERLAPDTTDAAIAWLERHVDDGPFFFWVHYQDPHGPYTPPPAYAEQFANPPSGETLTLTRSRYGRGGIPEYQHLEGHLDPAHYQGLYDAEIRLFDDQVGRLFDWLRAQGFFEDTLIVFTADHGESLGEHGFWFCHGENTYREEVRVPLVVRYLDGMSRPPPEEQGGLQVCQRVASHLDLWSTVLEALGVAPPPSRGQSLLGEIPEKRYLGQFLYPEEQQPKWWSVGDGRHRVVWNENEGLKLFDIRADPGETNDLYATNRQKVESMSAELQSVLEDIRGKPLPQGVWLKFDDETQAAMEALGYAESGADR